MGPPSIAPAAGRATLLCCGRAPREPQSPCSRSLSLRYSRCASKLIIDRARRSAGQRHRRDCGARSARAPLARAALARACARSRPAGLRRRRRDVAAPAVASAGLARRLRGVAHLRARRPRTRLAGLPRRRVAVRAICRRSRMPIATSQKAGIDLAASAPPIGRKIRMPVKMPRRPSSACSRPTRIALTIVDDHRRRRARARRAGRGTAMIDVGGALRQRVVDRVVGEVVADREVVRLDRASTTWWPTLTSATRDRRRTRTSGRAARPGLRAGESASRRAAAAGPASARRSRSPRARCRRSA